MATSTNVFVLTDQPPTLGRIDSTRAGDQIQQFLRDLAKYKRRHEHDGVAIPQLNQLMEEEDLEMLRIILDDLFVQDDKDLHPEEYRVLEDEDEEEQNDLQAMASRRRAARAALRGDPVDLSTTLAEEEAEGSSTRKSIASFTRQVQKARAQKAIEERRRAFDKKIFSEESLVAGLRMLYGPQNFQQADAVLKLVKMDKKGPHYRSPQPAIEYIAQFDLALEWIADINLSQKVIIKQFIKGVQPADLSRELELQEFKSYQNLKNQFARVYLDNHRSFKKLGAIGAFDDFSGGSNKKIDSPASTGSKSQKSSVSGTDATAKSRWTKATEEQPQKEPTKEAKGTATPVSDKTCFHCQRKGHIATNCPDRAAGTPAIKPSTTTAATPAKAANAPASTPKRTNGSALRRDSEVKRCKVACFVGAQGNLAPTLSVQVKLDSYSDCNLIPEQWLVVLRGEGVEIKELDTPLDLRWEVGEASVRSTKTVDLAMRIIGWARQEVPTTATFYVLPGDRDELTIGYPTLDEWDLFADMRSLVAAQRALGFAQVVPSPQGDPEVKDMDGRVASLVERDADQSERKRLAEEARWQTEPLDPDCVDPNTVGPEQLFIGRHSLAWLLPELLASGVFQATLERGGEAEVPPMKIILRDGFTVPYVKGFRRYSPRMQEAMDLDVSRQVSMGVVEPCSDAAVQEVVMVRKDDAPNGFRMTLDARAVNAGMVVEPCNPPPVKEVLQALGAKSYYARLDLVSAYWQFPLAPEAQHLSAFRVGQQTYRYKVAWMGGAGASHHVQRSLGQILRVYLGHGVWLYIDDIVIAADTADEFVQLLRGVVGELARHNIKCKLPKCVIGVWSISLLGHILSARGVRIADDKREEVARLPCPANPKQLRSALGQLNFQRAFIPNYAILTKPLTALVNGTSAQLRNPEVQAAWGRLMEAVAGQLALEHLDYSAQTRVRVDASRQGVGGALFNVRFIEGRRCERLVAVCSHAFTETEANWATTEQEAFAMIFACKYWFPLLEGIRFVIDGDHRNLAFVHGGSSPKVIRWSLFLQSLSYIYNHIAGTENIFPDMLSRQDFTRTDLVTPELEDFPTLDGAAEGSNNLAGVQHAIRISRAITRAEQSPLAPSTSRDEDSSYLDKEHLLSLIDEESADEQDNGKCRAPPDAITRVCQPTTRAQRTGVAARPGEGGAGAESDPVDRPATTENHDEPTALIALFHNNAEGHHGIHRTVWALQAAGHQWSRMGRSVAEFIEGCVHCQKNRPTAGAPSQERGSLRQYTLFEEVSIDFIGPLPKDQVDNSYIMICVCCFSGYVEAFPVEAATAVIAAHCLINVVARYMAPARIRSDRGTHFVNETIQELQRVFMITGITTPPYRPQANGVAEVNGGQVVRHLRALVEQPEARELWSVVLPLATRIINNIYQPRLGCRPTDLVHVAPPPGTRGLLDPERPLTEQLPLTTEFVAGLHRAHESMLDAASMILLEEQRKSEKEQGTSEVRPISPGDLVLLHYPVRAPSKLHSRVAGPFRVTERKGNLVYARDLTSERVIERDAEMWTPFYMPRPMSEAELRMIAATDLGETAVEAILNHRGGTTRSKIEFEVLWTDGEKTWEPWKTVRQLAILDTYLKGYPKLRPLAERKRSGGV